MSQRKTGSHPEHAWAVLGKAGTCDASHLPSSVSRHAELGPKGSNPLISLLGSQAMAPVQAPVPGNGTPTNLTTFRDLETWRACFADLRAARCDTNPSVMGSDWLCLPELDTRLRCGKGVALFTPGDCAARFSSGDSNCFICSILACVRLLWDKTTAQRPERCKYQRDWNHVAQNTQQHHLKHLFGLGREFLASLRQGLRHGQSHPKTNWNPPTKFHLQRKESSPVLPDLAPRRHVWVWGSG